ncbi:MAG: cold shock domain-containing protein [Proteobacteria bacterium]|nr:cold shock domain-containing protein [Pseudomonadota bacterium]
MQMKDRTQRPTAGRRAGRVKWFSEESGKGYLVDEEGRDYFFKVSDVRGYELPRRGMQIEFLPSSNARGATACDVELLSPAPEQRAADDGRVHCHHCNSRIFPRLVVYRGVAQRSLCTRCGQELADYTPGYALGMMLGMQMLQASHAVKNAARAIRKFLAGG